MICLSQQKITYYLWWPTWHKFTIPDDTHCTTCLRSVPWDQTTFSASDSPERQSDHHYQSKNCEQFATGITRRRNIPRIVQPSNYPRNISGLHSQTCSGSRSSLCNRLKTINTTHPMSNGLPTNNPKWQKRPGKAATIKHNLCNPSTNQLLTNTV